MCFVAGSWTSPSPGADREIAARMNSRRPGNPAGGRRETVWCKFSCNARHFHGGQRPVPGRRHGSAKC